MPTGHINIYFIAFAVELASEAQIDTKRKGSIDVGSTGSPRTASPVVSSPTMTISAGSGGAPRKKAAIRTVGTQFKDSLESLMVTLENSEAHFVCCIKPNDQQAPDSYVDDTVLLQLKYLGITQTVRIRKEGYSLRMPFQQFWTKCVWVSLFFFFFPVNPVARTGTGSSAHGRSATTPRSRPPTSILPRSWARWASKKRSSSRRARPRCFASPTCTTRSTGCTSTR